MAASFVTVGEAWTKIGDNVNSITVVVDGNLKAYVVATATDAAPVAGTAGIPVEKGQGLYSADLAEFQIVAPAYVWARAARGRSTLAVIV